jgi:IclR family acetate operon transcriptional repressor
MCEVFCPVEHEPFVTTRRQEITADLVKSAGRTIQILEYFTEVRRDASICEISRALGYPQSSTAALLHTLTSMGYMVFDRRSRTYKPAGTVAFLGSWVDQRLARVGPVQAVMEAVAGRTHDMVLLGCRNELYVKYVQVIQPESADRICANGTMRPLVNSGAGRALVSGLPDEEIKRIVLRSNASSVAVEPVSHVEFLEDIKLFRRDGYFIAPTPVEGISQLVLTLPNPRGDSPLALALGGREDALNADCPDLLTFLQTTIWNLMGARVEFAAPREANHQLRVA